MIEVLFFAELREMTGEEKWTITDPPTTVRELKKQVKQIFHLGDAINAMVAVNEEYATDDTQLQSGDVIALIPPVSGG